MRKKLLYLLILFCVSLVGAQSFDIDEQADIYADEIIHENLKQFECSISEYTHEQSATRPTNVQVPSITRTASAHRSHSSNSQSNSAYRSDLNAQFILSALNYSESQILISGFIDPGSYFKSLCRLLI